MFNVYKNHLVLAVNSAGQCCIEASIISDSEVLAMRGRRTFATSLRKMSPTIKEEKRLLRKSIKETLGKIDEQNVKVQCS